MELLQKHDQTYHLMSIEQLQGLYQSIGLDFVQFFNELFHLSSSNSIELVKSDQVIILTETLMSNVSTILTSYLLNPEKSHIVIDHFLILVVFGLSSHLPLIFETKILPLKKVLVGTDSPPERWQYCLRDTNVAFGFAMGAMYIEQAFGDTDRLTAEEMIQSLRQTFEENLNKLSWIDETSKNEAKKKLKQMYQKIGYPDWIKDSNKLNQRSVQFEHCHRGRERDRENRLFFVVMPVFRWWKIDFSIMEFKSSYVNVDDHYSSIVKKSIVLSKSFHGTIQCS